MIIEDGMPYSSGDKGTPLQKEMRRVSGQETPAVWDADFHKKYVKNFIVSCKLVKRIGIITDIPAWQHGRFELNDEDGYPLHQFIVQVQVTDPKWLEGLKEGSRYGTTAFDAWWEDPKRQSERQLAVIERAATRWTPPGAVPEEAPKASPAKRKAVPVKKAPAEKKSST
jgi:hypothetical protein